MEIKTLYRYGNTIVSPVKPDGECSTLFRLIADPGMILENGEQRTPCVDVDSTEGWFEVPDSDDEDGLTVTDCLEELQRLGVEL